MATPTHDPKPAAANPNPDWQDKDIKLGPIVGALALLGVICVATAIGMFALFGRYSATTEIRDENVPAMSAVRELPPAPILQVNGRNDLDAYRKQQADLLHHYANTDKVRGLGRIPIARAMQLTAVDAPEDTESEEETPAPAPNAGGHP